MVIATKVFFPVDMAYQAGSSSSAPPRPNTAGLSRKHIFEAVEASLRRLGIDYIDLYQIHRWDYETPIEETVVNRLSELASQRGESNARLAYAWLLHQPGLAAPIVGASKIAHNEEAVSATQIKLSEEEIQLLGDGYKPHAVLGHT